MFSQENKNGYDIWSAFYDEYPNPTVAIDELTFPQFFSQECRKKILEIGCGTGRHTRRLIQAENKVTAIDVSSGMLVKLRQKIKNENLTLIEGDFMTFEIPNGPFDAIIMSLVLEHIDNLHHFFNKARQLLVPNGLFYFSEIHPERTSKGTMAHFKNSAGNEVQLKSSPHTEADISRSVTTNAFSIEKVETVCGTSELTQLNEKWAKHLQSPMIQVWVLRAID